MNFQKKTQKSSKSFCSFVDLNLAIVYFSSKSKKESQAKCLTACVEPEYSLSAQNGESKRSRTEGLVARTSIQVHLRDHVTPRHLVDLPSGKAKGKAKMVGSIHFTSE